MYLDEVWETTLVDFVTGGTDFLPLVVKDFLNDITEEEASSRRRLEEVKWEIGTWHFESINQVVAKIKESFFRVNIIEGRKIKISQFDTGSQTAKKTYEYTLGAPGDENLKLNSYNIRNITVKSAIGEIIGDRMSIKPKLDCHFISDESKDPKTWWKMDFDKEYIVKSVRIFVI